MNKPKLYKGEDAFTDYEGVLARLSEVEKAIDELRVPEEAPPAPVSENALKWVLFDDFATTRNIYDYSGRHEDTDQSDLYFSSSGKEYLRSPSASVCHASVDVLKDIWGKPWNNLALAYVHTLRPSSIRVIKFGGTLTLNSRTWRVTIHLEKDDRTIGKVTQEVEVSGIGIKTGNDFSIKLLGKQLPEPSDEPIVYCNLDAISKFKI